MKIKNLIPLFVSIILLASCGSPKPGHNPGPGPDIPEPPEVELADHTVLIYMSATNYESRYANETVIPGSSPEIPWDGCGYATKSIQQILSVPNKPDDVNILIMTGGTAEWTTKENGQYGDYDIANDMLQIHSVGSDGKLHLEQTYADNSMAAPETLAAFLSYGLQNYPAKRTGLVFWGHGAGTQGVSYDYLHYDNDGYIDGLTSREYLLALSYAFHYANIPNNVYLDWVGFDAGYTALQDIAGISSYFFDYMVCSQEEKEPFGWNYASWIDDLYEKKDTLDILKAICDGNMNFEGGIPDDTYSNTTCSILNLKYMKGYFDAFEDLAVALATTVRQATKDAFNDLMLTVHGFGSYTYYAQFDVKHFIEVLTSEANTQFVIDSAITDKVLEKLDELVEYEVHESGATNACGLSYFWCCSHNARVYTPYEQNDTPFYNWAFFNYVYGSNTYI